MRHFLHVVEFLIVKLMLLVFGSMNFNRASNIGGLLGRNIGPKLQVNKIARKNIKMAMPDLPDKKVEEILVGMWDNLGRSITEFSHMNKMTSEKIDELITVDGQEQLDALFKTKGGFMMTGHFGNWEMIPATPYRKGCPLHIVYRKANNPYVDAIICKMRESYQVSASAKGSIGARQIIQAIKQGKHIIMLVDQKQNDGIAIPFFGIPAMTAPGIATLALKYNCPIFPARIIRIKATKFKFITYPPIEITKSGNVEEDTINLMTEINNILEAWIRETPEQWFWVHNRWPKNILRNKERKFLDAVAPRTIK